MTPAAIRDLRHGLGWSQQRLAQELGVALTTVLRWEKGYAKPSPLAERQLAEFARTAGHTAGKHVV